MFYLQVGESRESRAARKFVLSREDCNQGLYPRVRRGPVVSLAVKIDKNTPALDTRG